MASALSPDHPNVVSYDLHDFQTSIFLCLIALLIIVLIVHIFERVHNWLRLEQVAQLDIESSEFSNHQPSLNENSDLLDEHAALNNHRVLEIVNRLMAYLAEKQRVSVLSRELLEQASPCVEYKRLGKTKLGDECVICLGGFEDDEMCRVFPVCNHVFHYKCIDNWLRNHLTCPICRNCIVDRVAL